MLSKLLEPLTSIGCALGAGAVGVLDGGLTAGALVGGTALIARFHEQCAKHGLDSTKLIDKMRLAVLRDWDRPDQTQEERDVIALASNAMAAHIADCLPTREELAATALKGERIYPAVAAALVVNRLALCSDDCRALFDAPGTARTFALDVVERALRLAKDDPDYAPLLTLDLVIEIAGGVGRIEAMLSRLVEEYRPAAEELKLTNGALVALARRIAENIKDPQQALDALGSAIEEFLRVRDAAAQGTNLGALVDQTLRNIAAANERGELDKGAAAGERGFAEWQDQQEAARQAGLKLIEANVEQHRLRFDATAMAHWIGQRLKLIGGGAIDFQRLRAEQDQWYQHGRIHGLRLDMDVSIALARRSVELATNEAEWGMGQNDLSLALWIQGERAAGTAGLDMLADAAAACRAALAVRTRASTPFQWAMTQGNLATILQVQAERTHSPAAFALLSDAVSACRAALTVYTEASTAADWAMTQNNLGNALLLGGGHLGGAAGLDMIADAVAVHRAVLTVCNGSSPVAWATAQGNLGVALRAQGMRTGGYEGLDLLAQAVAAFQAALTVFTAEGMSHLHLKAVRNLSIAESLIAERGG